MLLIALPVGQRDNFKADFLFKFGLNMKINSEMIYHAEKGQGIIHLERKYLDREGTRLSEHRFTYRQSDFREDNVIRYSEDNGESFGEWMPCSESSSGSRFYGCDELHFQDIGHVYDPINKLHISTRLSRYSLGGHKAAYAASGLGEATYFDHQYLVLRRDGEDEPFAVQMIKYEDGRDFDENDPRDPDFLYKNIGYLNAPIVLKSGKIAVPVGVTVRYACKAAGLDVSEVFPTAPDLHRAVMVAIGEYDALTEKYSFEFSSPVIIDDLRSSRGIDEPIITELSSGRLLLVMRGSNERYSYTRIAEGAPSYKWFSYSDDGGATFTPAEPWMLDDGSPVYSSATISDFVRSSKNGKLYWIGNITDSSAYGNDPRYPLCIAEVDEDTGLLISESVTVIDTRREGDLPTVQLSNFSVLENRITGNFELYLGKVWQYDSADPFLGETWKYEIVID